MRFPLEVVLSWSLGSSCSSFCVSSDQDDDERIELKLFIALHKAVMNLFLVESASDDDFLWWVLEVRQKEYEMSCYILLTGRSKCGVVKSYFT